MAKSKSDKKNLSATVLKTQEKVQSEPGIPFFTEGFWRKNGVAAAVLLILTFGLYYQSIQYGYVLDDLIVIQENKFTKQGIAGIKDIMTTESMTGYFGEQKNLVQGNRYRPLSLVTFAMEYEIYKELYPKASHFINILLYGLTGILLFMVLHLLFPGQKNIWLGLPFLASLIFIVHPIHVEAVANIKGRDEIMALLFSLASLYAALRYTDKQENKWLIFTVLYMFLGLLSKENAITFLAVIPLTIYFFSKNNRNGMGMLVTSLVGITVFYLMVRFNYSGVPKLTEVSKDLMNNPFLDMTFVEKMSTIFYTLGKYVVLLFFPHPLTHDYYPYAIPKVGITDPYALASIALYGVMVWYAYKNYQKKDVSSYSILFYLATLSIVSNIVINLGTFMNDRFIFMASVGFCIWLVYMLMEKLKDRFLPYGKYVGMALLGVFTVFYAYKTYSRIPDWENALTLNRSAIRVSANSARANSFMATALYNQYKAMESNNIPEKLAVLREALPYAQKACEIMPEYYNGNIMEAGIVGEIFRLDGDMPLFIKNIKPVMLRRPDLPYLKEYSDYVVTQGYYPKELYTLFKEVGQALTTHKKYSKLSIQYFNFAYKLSPTSPEINALLAAAYEKQGDRLNAIRHAAKAKEQ
ncbi:MAG: DUF1736 domain-containing protein [Saprospiraceae bacterium]|nr:DUF1736 domain-containing protein [Saprospiraceae bacterium]